METYLGALAFTLEHLDKDTGLVVGEGREDLGLLGGDGGVAGNELGHHTTSSLDTQGERGNIEQQDLVGGLGAGVTAENSSLDSGTVGNSLIGVDGLVGLLAVEVVGNELLHAGDTGRSTDEDDLMDLGLVDLSVGKNAVDGLQSGSEEILAQLLEAGTGDGGVEVDTLEERVDLNGGLGRRREGTLGTLASGAETTQSTSVGAEILLVLALELVHLSPPCQYKFHRTSWDITHKVVHETVIKVFTSQVSITSGALKKKLVVSDLKRRERFEVKGAF